MKTLAVPRFISHCFNKFPEYKKNSLTRVFHIVLTLIFFAVLEGCSKDKPSSEKDMLIKRKELLTSTIWGEVSICGFDSDPEKYARIFERGGQYVEYNKVYQSLYGATWSLKDYETLIFMADEYKIVELNNNMLEIRSRLCTFRFKALNQTKNITLGVTALTKTFAKLHGSVSTCSLTDVSFEYGTSTDYGTIVTPYNNTLQGPSIKIFSIEINNLLPEKVYHYRIRTENSSGTYYGQDQIFRTFNNETVTDADNNTYFTTTIGSQVWMTENLKTTKYNDGNAILRVRDDLQWKGLSAPAYSWYNNDSLNIYGVLYNWYAVDAEKLCPDGWHIPNEEEWTTLKLYLNNNAGSKLTEGGYDLAYPLSYTYPDSQTEASNETGFSARFSGIRTWESYFYTSYCELWSRTEENLQNARSVLISNGLDVPFLSENKKSGLPVRCLKN